MENDFVNKSNDTNECRIFKSYEDCNRKRNVCMTHFCLIGMRRYFILNMFTLRGYLIVHSLPSSNPDQN
jgi:hypothetical protein